MGRENGADHMGSDEPGGDTISGQPPIYPLEQGSLLSTLKLSFPGIYQQPIPVRTRTEPGNPPEPGTELGKGSEPGKQVGLSPGPGTDPEPDPPDRDTILGRHDILSLSHRSISWHISSRISRSLVAAASSAPSSPLLLPHIDVPPAPSSLYLDPDLLSHHHLLDMRSIMSRHHLSILHRTLPHLLPPLSPSSPSSPPVPIAQFYRRSSLDIHTRALAGSVRNDQLIEGVRTSLDGVKRVKRYDVSVVMDSQQLTDNMAILERMRRKQDYLVNPLYNRQLHDDRDRSGCSVIADPHLIQFTAFAIDRIYHATIALTNPDRYSIRYRVEPPSTRYFRIVSSSSSGIIAPGMSITLQIRFAPDRLTQYRDQLLVRSSLDQLLDRQQPSIVIPIRADHNPSRLTCPDRIQAPPCHLFAKQEMIMDFTNDGGDGVFHFFLGEDCSHDDEREITIRSFTISPRKFHLRQNDSVTIRIVFGPRSEHVAPSDDNRLTGSFTLRSCSLSDASSYSDRPITLSGEYFHVKLDLIAIDGSSVVVGDVRSIYRAVVFPDIAIGSSHAKTISLSNPSPIPVRYSWAISPDRGETPFTIHPISGVFPAQGVVVFQIVFTARTVASCSSIAVLSVGDVPFGSTHKHTTIDRDLDDHFPSDRHPIPDDHVVPSIPFLDLTLFGSGIASRLDISPTAIVDNPPIVIASPRSYQVQLGNNGSSPVDFRLALDHIEGGRAQITISPDRGSVGVAQSVAVQISVEYGDPGRIQLHIRCDNSLGVTDYIYIRDDVILPIIAISPGICDLGLINYGHDRRTKSGMITISNPHSISIPYRLYALGDPGPDPQVRLAPSSGVLAPFQFTEVVVVFAPDRCQRYRSTIVCETVYGSKSFISIRAEVVSETQHTISTKPNLKSTISPSIQVIVPDMILAPWSVSLADLFVHVPVEVRVRLQNPTDLVARFAWDDAIRPEYGDGVSRLSISPSGGEVAGLGAVDIALTIVFAVPGPVQVLIACDVQGLIWPIPLRIQGTVQDIAISVHELNRDLESIDDHDELFPNDQISCKSIDFGRIDINSYSEKRFLIRNHTAVPSSFKIDIESSESDHDPVQVDNLIKLLQGNESTSSFDLNQGSSDILNIICGQDRAGSKSTGFQSASGRKYIHDHDRDDNIHKVLGRRPFRVITDKREGIIGPYALISITVYALNNFSGQYHDQITCRVQYMAQPLILNCSAQVTGSPLSIISSSTRLKRSDPDFGHDDQGDVSMVFDHILYGSGGRDRYLVIHNKGAYDISISWDLYDQNRWDYRQVVDLKLDHHPDNPGQVQCRLDLYRPEPVAVDHPFPYQVIPSSHMIAARSSQRLTIRYHARDGANRGPDPDLAWVQSRIAIRSSDLALIQRSAPSPDMVWVPVPSELPIRIFLSGCCIDPYMTPSCPNIIFTVFANDIRHEYVQWIPITNRMPVQLSFRIRLSDRDHLGLVKVDSPRPVSALSPWSSSPSTSQFTADPGDNLMIAIRYHPDRFVSPAPLVQHRTESLSLQYRNGTTQSIPVQISYHIPFVQIDIDRHHFGHCHIDQTTPAITVHLHNRSQCPTIKYRIVHVKRSVPNHKPKSTDPVILSQLTNPIFDTESEYDHDSAVFAISPLNNEVRSRSWSIRCSFTPRLARPYLCRYRVEILSGPSLELILTGIGSHQEHHYPR